ncbi:MAG: hypothetical protein IPG32_04885 [Saprospirales bacterium]|nr:hypothetical protein [Saprospirales bacterium]
MNKWRLPLVAGAGFTESALEPVDITATVPVQAAQRITLLNNSENGWAESQNWPFPVVAGAGFTEDDGDGDNGVRFADLNNDGFMDFVMADGEDQRATFINNRVDNWATDNRWPFRGGPGAAGAGFSGGATTASAGRIMARLCLFGEGPGAPFSRSTVGRPP